MKDLADYVGHINSWKLLALSILLIAILTRFVASTTDPLNYDDYKLMNGVDKSFSEYKEMGKFYLPLLIHYWVSYRVFGNSLLGYRLLPLLSSVALLLIVYFAIPRYRSSGFKVCFFTLIILAFNRHSLRVAAYSMFTYSNSLTVSCLIFFIFLKLSTGFFSRRQWALMTLVIVPSAFFSNLPILVPIATGMFSVIAFRWWQFPSERNLASVWRVLWEMKPMMLFPLVHLATWILVWTYAPFPIQKDSYMASSFFHTSFYTQNPIGALHFAFDNTVKLFTELLLPYGIPGRAIQHSITKSSLMPVSAFLIVAIVVITVILLVRRKFAPKVSFTLIFIYVTFISILGGGILGIYPFGMSRYSFYLLIPVAVLIAHGAPLALDLILAKVRMPCSTRAISIVMAIVIILPGIYLNIFEYRRIAAAKNRDSSALESIGDIDADLILLSSDLVPLFKLKAQEQYLKSYAMGYGIYKESRTRSVPDDIPEEIARTIIRNNHASPAESILVVARSERNFADSYPSWSRLITTYFNKVNSIDAPFIWGGYYVRK